MKKNVMALSIAAMIGGLGFAGAASADVIVGTGATPLTVADMAAGKIAAPTANNLEVTRAGVGHALIVPYFNAQNGNMTVLHVTNTDQVNGKVAKVRFRSASNSDDLLDFQVFLSPGDVWTAAITADANGLAQIVTADNTCTVPALAAGVPQSFNNSSARLPSYLTEAQRNALTREGYVEIFNVADISALKAFDTNGALNAAGPNRSALYTATKHVSGVAPCSVAGSAARTLLNNAAIADYTTQLQAATAGLDSGSGGLMGDWYIINVPQTTTFSGAATAIVANTGAGTAPAVGNFRHFAQLGNNLVTLSADAANGVTADPLFRNVNVFDAAGAKVTTAALTMLNYDAPDLSTPFFSAATSANTLAQSTALLTALSVKSVTNQYALDASITAKTDWVFSMPARRYNVAANYAAVTGTTGATGPTTANAKYRLFTDLNANGTQAGEWFYPAVSADYTTGAGTYKAGGNTTVDTAGNICVFADGQKFFDREETSASAGPVFSPGTASTVSFCGEVSVLAFQDTGNSVLGASVARNTVTSGFYTNGWGVIDTTNAAQGLPLLGESFIKLSNPQAGAGVSGTYGINWAHRFTR
ncbi:cell surface protein [Acidovorax sp. BL-A-41-H1]|uniref:cell surface protein n=1 Tax=Acidovorax sp. BL-A-41-H1 TaxID=3421102 RepID=UPI003F7A61EF